MKRQWTNAISESAKKQGNLLRNIREAAGLTMRQLSMQIGVSHTAISQVEHGKLELPYGRIEQIVKACGQSMADFEKMMGKSFVVPNYRDECISMLKALDEDAVSIIFQLLVRMGTKAVEPKARLEAL